MDRADVSDLIIACFQDTVPATATPDENTILFGRNGTLDSMQLLNLLMEIEQRANERFGTMISIADDRAMSQARSPFRTIGTVTDYVATLVAEQQPAT